MASSRHCNAENIKILKKECSKSHVTLIYENISKDERIFILYMSIFSIILYKRFSEIINSNKEKIDDIVLNQYSSDHNICARINCICEPIYEIDVIKLIINEVEYLKNYVMNFEELEHFKSFISEFKSNHKKSQSNRQKNHEELINRIIKHDNGKDDDITTDEVLFSSITPENFQNFIEKNFSKEQLKITIIVPKHEKNIISFHEIQKALDSSLAFCNSKKLNLFTPIQILDTSSLPLPGLIVKTTKKANSITYFLSNGAKVQLNSHDSRAHRSLGIDLEITAEGGYYEVQMECPEKLASTKILSYFAKYISLGNVNLNINSLDLGIILEDFNILPFEKAIKFTCLPSKFEKLLQVVHNIFTACDVNRWTDKACQEEIEIMKNIIKQPKSVDSYFFENTFKFNWNHDYQTLKEKELKIIDLEFTRKYFRQTFSNPSEFIFILNGDFNYIPNITWLIQKYIGSIPIPNKDDSSLRREIIISKSIAHFESNVLFTKGVKEKVLYYGEGDKSIVQITYPLPGLNSYAELMVIDLLKEILEMHLFDKIMDHIGNIYSFKVETFHPFGIFFKGELSIKLTCDPLKVDVLSINILKSINDLRNNGPSHSILCTVKKNIINFKSYLKHIIFNDNMKIFDNNISAADFDTFMDDLLVKDVIASLLPQDNYTCVKLLPNSFKQKSFNILTKLGTGIVISALCSAMIPIIRNLIVRYSP